MNRSLGMSTITNCLFLLRQRSVPWHASTSHLSQEIPSSRVNRIASLQPQHSRRKRSHGWLCEVLFSLCLHSLNVQSGIYLAIQGLAVFKCDFGYIIGFAEFHLKLQLDGSRKCQQAVWHLILVTWVLFSCTRIYIRSTDTAVQTQPFNTDIYSNVQPMKLWWVTMTV